MIWQQFQVMKKNDKNDILDYEKEVSFPDDTTPGDMDVVNDDAFNV